MTIILFLEMLVILATATSLITEAIKSSLKKLGKTYKSEVIVLITSFVVSIMGSSIYFIFTDTNFDLKNILSILCLYVCVFVGSEIGYDKIIELIKKIK